MIEWIALPAKAAAVGRRDHSNVRRRHFQHSRKRSMKVMWRLRARPDGQFSFGVFNGNRRVLLDREVSAPLIEESVLEDFICFRKPLFDVAELERHALVDVSLIAVVMNPRLRRGKRLL